MKQNLLRAYSALTKVFIAYFPVILVSFQVLVNLSYFFYRPFYTALGWHLNAWFGTNILTSIFFLIYTHKYKFCYVSKWAARAEILFALNLYLVSQNELYNIIFQCIVGVIALLITFRHYVRKFPLCNLSLVVRFFKFIFEENSCTKGAKRMDDYLKTNPNKNGEYT